MLLDSLKRKILEMANDKYPRVALIERDPDTNQVIGFPECSTDEFEIALKELQDNFFLINAIQISCQGEVSLGHLEITTIGRNFLAR